MSNRRGKKAGGKKPQPEKKEAPKKQAPKGGSKQGKGGRQKGGPKGAKQQPAPKGKIKAKKEKVSDKKGRGKVTKGGPKADVARERLNLIVQSKFQNPNKNRPSPLESQICSYLVDLEATQKDLKQHLRDLGIVKAQQITISQKKNCIVIFVPYAQHEKWQKIQDRIVRELEKKFSGQEVIVIAERNIMKLNQINPKTNYPRPRNQTITAVHESILDDVVFPTKIVGKRLRFRVGGQRLLKVYLDPKDSKDIETRLPTYEKVYRTITKKNVKFLFPRYVI